MLTHVDLFSGLGGFALAAQWAGFRTVCFCEIDEFCREVLKARFGAVADSQGAGQLREKQSKDGHKGQRGPGSDDPIAQDSGLGPVAETKSGEAKSTESDRLHSKFGLQNRIPLIPDIRDFDGTQWKGATLLTGGVPCQPASIAGKRRGTADDRWLWPEAVRVLAEVKPAWGVFENPCGILSLEQGVVFENLLSQMESEGYEVWPIIIPACAVNAPHRRDRVWIIGHACQSGRPKIQGCQPSGADSDVPDAERIRIQGCQKGQTEVQFGRSGWDIPWLEVAARFCRMDDRLPSWIHAHRVPRLKALGNAIVPQVAYEIIKGIAEIERGGGK